MGASGGKDSTVLAHMLKLLNDRYDYGIEIVLLSIDEGIIGYRDDSLATVKRNQQQYGLPLEIFSFKDLYDWTMDEIVSVAGIRNSCTYCGVLEDNHWTVVLQSWAYLTLSPATMQTIWQRQY